MKCFLKKQFVDFRKNQSTAKMHMYTGNITLLVFGVLCVQNKIQAKNFNSNFQYFPFFLAFQSFS